MGVKGGRMAGLPYTVRAWGGLPLFCCGFCPFDAFDEDSILEHYATRHSSAVSDGSGGSDGSRGSDESRVLVADRYGQEVRR